MSAIVDVSFKRVQHSDREGRIHCRRDFALVHPPHLRGFFCRMSLARNRTAAKDEGNNSVTEVLVNACKPIYSHRQACLLQYFAADTLLERLVEFQHATGSLPMTGVIAPDHQNSALVVHYDTGDTD